MLTSVVYRCEACGMEFPDHLSCAAHEATCGRHPDSGLYIGWAEGSTVLIRVDREAMTMRTVFPYPFRSFDSHLSCWDWSAGCRRVCDAEAVAEIHGILSAVEDASLTALGLSPFGREAPR